MTEDAKARYVAARLAEKRWKQADLVRETGLDKNTISDFLSGKREPSLATLAKIEDALVLTRGTLAALGEDPSAGQPAEGPAAAAAHLTDEELLADLTYRLQQLKRQNVELAHEVAELARDAKRYRTEAEADQAFLIEHSDEPALGWIADRISRLNFMAAEESWGSEDAREYQEHWARVHWLRLLHQNAPAWVKEWLSVAALEMDDDSDLTVHEAPNDVLAQQAAEEDGSDGDPDDDGESGAPTGPGPETPPDAPPAPVSNIEARRRRALDAGQLVETAADDRKNEYEGES